MEVHDNPTEALSDGTSSLDLNDLTLLLKKLKRLFGKEKEFINV